MGFVGTAPGTTTLSLPDGTTIALADWIDDKLYGSIQITNGVSSSTEAFSNGRSQPIPGGQRVQTSVDTNIPRNGDSGLPKDWEMLIYGIGIKYSRVCRPSDGSTQPILQDGVSNSLSNVLQLNTMFQIDRVMFFEFRYNDKQYSQGVPQDYPQGHGFNVFSTNQSFEISQNGVPSPRDRVALVLPIHMRENLGYKAIYQPAAPPVISQTPSSGTTALTFVDIKTYLYGLIKRTVV